MLGDLCLPIQQTQFLLSNSLLFTIQFKVLFVSYIRQLY